MLIKNVGLLFMFSDYEYKFENKSLVLFSKKPKSHNHIYSFTTY